MLRMFIYNPSFTLNACINLITSFLNQKFMIRFKVIKKGNEKDFMQVIDPSQWEKRYGGELPDLEEGQFWPPTNYGKDTVLTREEIEEKGIMTFDVMGNLRDFEVFGPEYKPLKKDVKEVGPDDWPVWFMEDGAHNDQVYYGNGVN